MISEKQFCPTCKGDGVVPIYGQLHGKRMRTGQGICPACDGHCYATEPATPSSNERTEMRYEEYGYTVAELAALCRTKDRHIERLESSLREIRFWSGKSPAETGDDLRPDAHGVVLQRIRDEVGETLFGMLSGATWLCAVEAATGRSVGSPAKTPTEDPL